MSLLLLGLGLMASGGVLAQAASRWPRLCSLFGVSGAVTGSMVGLVPVLLVLCQGPADSLSIPWNVPYGSFTVELDALSAFFVLPILVVTALAAIYGAKYFQGHAAHKSLGSAWLFYNLLTASMVLVVVARNGVLFLVAWEVMALTSFFLVTFEDESESVRAAGWTYLVATHLGTAFLLGLFLLLGKEAGGSLEFDDFALIGTLTPSTAGLLFVFALVGFGTKAGLMPFHVWLPEAHPAAPSHVSAVMSGVMIKTGIYGLVRILSFLGEPPAWWAWLLIGMGLVSGILGILFASAQKDLKRLLAYSSVENIGIIGLGLGIGLLGLSSKVPALAVLGIAGALLHVLNHALFKGMLFLSAGAVLHATGTVELDRLGGLLRPMPRTALAFLVGGAAIAGLPPLNGFIGEYLIYMAAFGEEMNLSSLSTIPPLAVIAGLALIGGLAAACFTKAFGIVFLGSPRSQQAVEAHGTGFLMYGPMLLLAVGCLAIGLFAPRLVPLLAQVVGTVTGLDADTVFAHLAPAAGSLRAIVLISCVFFFLVIGLTVLRLWLLHGRSVTAGETWGCGYARPTASMQYTSSSFAQPMTELFAPILRTVKREPVIAEYFPQKARLETSTPEPLRESFYDPAFRGVASGLGRLRWLQHGRVQLYVLYIALTILFLLVWYLGFGA